MELLDYLSTMALILAFFMLSGILVCAGTMMKELEAIKDE